MSSATLCLVVLAVIFFFLVTEFLPLAVTAMGGAVLMGFVGLVPIKDCFSGLSHAEVVLTAGMFVVGAAMFHTGLAQKMGEWVVRMTGRSENTLLFGCMGTAAVMSSVLSNTGTAASLFPVVFGICAASRIPPQRQLMPMAFACGLGGVITLVGTPSNIIASSALEQAGFAGFGFLDFAWVGVPLTVAGILYMVFVGKRLLPRENTAETGIDEEAAVEAQASTNDPKKMVFVAVIFCATIVMLAAGAGIVPMEVTAIAAALLLVLTGCLTEKQAYAGIDWPTIFLFAGMVPISTALDQSGASVRIAESVIGLLGGTPSPLTVTAALFLLSCGLTQFMSNTASAALLCPIGLSVAQNIGADPHAVLMAIAVAASCAFATPVGTPPNTLVFSPGGYKFKDYVIVGTPLVLLSFAVSMIVIPLVWPFFP